MEFYTVFSKTSASWTTPDCASLVFESGSESGRKSAVATSIVRIFSQTPRRGGGDGARL